MGATGRLPRLTLIVTLAVRTLIKVVVSYWIKHI